MILPNGMTSVNVTWTLPIASDDVDMVNLTTNHNPGEAFNPGNTQVVYTATDSMSQTTLCVFSVGVSPTGEIKLAIICNSFMFFQCELVSLGLILLSIEGERKTDK